MQLQRTMTHLQPMSKLPDPVRLARKMREQLQLKTTKQLVQPLNYWSPEEPR
jgi:hypothetical protein